MKKNNNPIIELFNAPPIPRYYKPDGSLVPIGTPLHRHRDGTIMTKHSMGSNDDSVVVTITRNNKKNKNNKKQYSEEELDHYIKKNLEAYNKKDHHPNLPSAYGLPPKDKLSQVCHNCQFYKDDQCNIWNAPVEEKYWCKKWKPKRLNLTKLRNDTILKSKGLSIKTKDIPKKPSLNLENIPEKQKPLRIKNIPKNDVRCLRIEKKSANHSIGYLCTYIGNDVNIRNQINRHITPTDQIMSQLPNEPYAVMDECNFNGVADCGDIVLHACTEDDECGQYGYPVDGDCGEPDEWNCVQTQTDCHCVPQVSEPTDIDLACSPNQNPVGGCMCCDANNTNTYESIEYSICPLMDDETYCTGPIGNSYGCIWDTMNGQMPGYCYSPEEWNGPQWTDGYPYNGDTYCQELFNPDWIPGTPIIQAACHPLPIEEMEESFELGGIGYNINNECVGYWTPSWLDNWSLTFLYGGRNIPFAGDQWGPNSQPGVCMRYEDSAAIDAGQQMSISDYTKCSQANGDSGLCILVGQNLYNNVQGCPNETNLIFPEQGLMDTGPCCTYCPETNMCYNSFKKYNSASHDLFNLNDYPDDIEEFWHRGAGIGLNQYEAVCPSSQSYRYAKGCHPDDEYYSDFWSENNPCEWDVTNKNQPLSWGKGYNSIPCHSGLCCDYEYGVGSGHGVDPNTGYPATNWGGSCNDLKFGFPNPDAYNEELDCWQNGTLVDGGCGGWTLTDSLTAQYCVDVPANPGDEPETPMFSGGAPCYYHMGDINTYKNQNFHINSYQCDSTEPHKYCSFTGPAIPCKMGYCSGHPGDEAWVSNPFGPGYVLKDTGRSHDINNPYMTQHAFNRPTYDELLQWSNEYTIDDDGNPVQQPSSYWQNVLDNVPGVLDPYVHDDITYENVPVFSGGYETKMKDYCLCGPGGKYWKPYEDEEQCRAHVSGLLNSLQSVGGSVNPYANYTNQLLASDPDDFVDSYCSNIIDMEGCYKGTPTGETFTSGVRCGSYKLDEVPDWHVLFDWCYVLEIDLHEIIEFAATVSGNPFLIFVNDTITAAEEFIEQMTELADTLGLDEVCDYTSVGICYEEGASGVTIYEGITEEAECQYSYAATEIDVPEECSGVTLDWGQNESGELFVFELGSIGTCPGDDPAPTGGSWVEPPDDMSWWEPNDICLPNGLLANMERCGNIYDPISGQYIQCTGCGDLPDGSSVECIEELTLCNRIADGPLFCMSDSPCVCDTDFECMFVGMDFSFIVGNIEISFNQLPYDGYCDYNPGYICTEQPDEPDPDDESQWYNTCVGRCGEYTQDIPSGGCQCDWECYNRNDCCSDGDSHCRWSCAPINGVDTCGISNSSTEFGCGCSDYCIDFAFMGYNVLLEMGCCMDFGDYCFMCNCPPGTPVGNQGGFGFYNWTSMTCTGCGDFDDTDEDDDGGDGGGGGGGSSSGSTSYGQIWENCDKNPSADDCFGFGN